MLYHLTSLCKRSPASREPRLSPSRVMVPRPNLNEVRSQPRTIIRVMWSHCCPNLFTRYSLQSFRNHLPPFLLSAKYLSKTFPFSNHTGRAIPFPRFFENIVF